MAVLVRAPQQLEAEARQSAERQHLSMNSWWVEAAEQKLAREEWDVKAITAAINSDGVSREVLNRLGQ